MLAAIPGYDGPWLRSPARIAVNIHRDPALLITGWTPLAFVVR
jgi:hypothetical protein